MSRILAAVVLAAFLVPPAAALGGGLATPALQGEAATVAEPVLAPVAGALPPAVQDAVPPRDEPLGGLAEPADPVVALVVDAIPVPWTPPAPEDLLPLFEDPGEDAAPQEPAPAEPAPAPEGAAPPAEGGPSVAPLPPGAALVGVAAVAAAPGLPAGLGLGRFRRVGLLAVLYTRIAKERLLDHGRRDALLSAIRDRPGIAVADLVEATGIPRNTTVYHLLRMEKEGLVSSLREGRTRLYFAPGSVRHRAESHALAALRHDTSRAIAHAVATQPGIDQNALCQRFGLSPSLAHWHADRLATSGLVEKRREGRRVRYFPGDAVHLLRSEPRILGA